jgi:hypothetical protein
VLRNTLRVLRPGGHCVHLIDLREHRDFSRPLDFLRLGEAEYRERTGAPENRLRAGDWLELFAKAGFEIASARFMDRAPGLLASGQTDAGRMLLVPCDALYPRRQLSEIEPWVDDALRASFDPAYRSKSLAELSALGMHVVARRPD